MTIKSFTLGTIAGASALVLAVPLMAQFAAAQNSSTSKTAQHPVPSQACVQAMATEEDTRLAGIDAMIAVHKGAMQAHRDALTAAAGIADDTERQTALKAAQEAFRTAMQQAKPDAETMKTSMEALKTACGDSFRGPMGGGFLFKKMGGPGMHGTRGGHKMMKRLEQNGTFEEPAPTFE